VIPPASANFAQIPLDFLSALVCDGYGRNELLVLIYMASKTFALVKQPVFFSLDELVSATSLDKPAVTAALGCAIEKSIAVRVPVENDPANPHCFMLNTPEAAFLTESEELPPPAPAVVAPPRPIAPAPVPANPPSSPPGESRRPSGAFRALELQQQADPILSRIAALLGRSLAKDEAERIKLLDAGDEILIEAIDAVAARTGKPHSADLVVYEVEAIQRRRKGGEGATSTPSPSGKARERVKACQKCGGTGYLLSKNSIKICDCRR
jgi:hypothetical protein